MQGSSFLSVVSLFLFVGALIYQIKPLKRTKIWNLTLQQIIMLVVIPGMLFPMVFRYLQRITELPVRPSVFVPDSWLVNLVLMALLFTYGGIAIHAVTKVLSDLQGSMTNEMVKTNRYFHMTFSHNLAFMGIALASLGLALLEMNHIPLANTPKAWEGVVRGLLMGFSFWLATYNYTRYTGGDLGRWNDLKMSFAVIWVAFMVLLYGIDKVEPRITEYEMLLPMLLSFSLMVGLSLVLVVRRLKRGGWRVMVDWKRVRWLFGRKETK